MYPRVEKSEIIGNPHRVFSRNILYSRGGIFYVAVLVGIIIAGFHSPRVAAARNGKCTYFSISRFPSTSIFLNRKSHPLNPCPAGRDGETIEERLKAVYLYIYIFIVDVVIVILYTRMTLVFFFLRSI